MPYVKQAAQLVVLSQSRTGTPLSTTFLKISQLRYFKTLNAKNLLLTKVSKWILYRGSSLEARNHKGNTIILHKFEPGTTRSTAIFSKFSKLRYLKILNAINLLQDPL